jgi:hypothetical protein
LAIPWLPEIVHEDGPLLGVNPIEILAPFVAIQMFRIAAYGRELTFDCFEGSPLSGYSTQNSESIQH